MSSMKLLFAVLSLAVLNISFNSLPTYALAVEGNYLARSFNHAHAGITKKKRDVKRCKPRSTDPLAASTNSFAASTTTYTSSSAPVTPSSMPQSGPAAATSSPAPANTPLPSSSGNRKVGLAWSNQEDKALPKFQSSHTHYIYNWQLKVYGDVDPSKYGMQFIPMVHSAKDASGAREAVTASGAKILFGFNEPDQPGPPDLSPSAAVQLWRQYIDDLSQDGVQLISPAPTNSHAGVLWIQDFMRLCTGCHVSAIAAHYYGTDPADFKSHVTMLHNTLGLNIWITEFACEDFSGANKQSSAGQVSDFLTQTQSFLEGADFVVAYFWFAPMTRAEIQGIGVSPDNALMNDDGSPSTLGTKYLNP